MNRRIATLILSALALALLPSAAGAAATGATIDKTGWWNRANTTAPTPAGPVTIPPPPGVPEGDLVVGALGSEPTAILAIGIQPDDEPGATVKQFTLRITEDPEAPSNQGTAGAAIIACPITEFWAGGANGDWATRPVDDCTAASVAGTRGDDGVWTFDLTPIARLWFDPFGTIVADGIVLRPDLEETDPFQAVFRGGDAIDVNLVADPAPGGDDDGFAIPPSGPVPTDSGLSAGGGDSGIFSPPGISSPVDGSFDAPDTPAADIPPTEEPGAGGDEGAAPAVDSPATEPVASRAGDVFGNFSPLVLLGSLLFAGVLVAMSYWLGPAGQPVTTVRRRGVSRALDARLRTTKES